MAELRLSAQAERDLIGIQDYGDAMFGEVASRRHMAGFDRVFDLLCAHPLAGEARPGWGESMRAMSYRPHRILYRINGDTVRIVRVLHMRRDVRRALSGGH
jgi:toxin ParE1/3/4